MARIILAFFVTVAFWHVLIYAWRHATNKERLSSIKLLLYSVGLGMLTVLTLSVFVLTF